MPALPVAQPSTTGEAWHNIFPLVHINDPSDIWNNQPSFLIAEVVFSLFFLSITRHAFLGSKDKLETSKRVTLWSASIMGGIFIELITVLKKDVGNVSKGQPLE